MRAGIVHIKLPMEGIRCDRLPGGVDGLKKSIKRFGLLQPIGVVREAGGYRLVFGHRRLQACRELGWRYIHCELLSLLPEEISYVAKEENLRPERKQAELSGPPPAPQLPPPEKQQLVIFGDSRVYLNEIARIAAQMRRNGYEGMIEENEDTILFRKTG